MKYYTNRQSERLLYMVDDWDQLFAYQQGEWNRAILPVSWERFHQNYRELSKEEVVKRVLKQ